jgi:phage tail sheath protein FI
MGSAGISTREIDLSGPLTASPTGVPAGIIGTALKGPAFVPITVGVIDDFFAKFGPSDGKKFGVIAVSEWLKNRQSVIYTRVLGAGSGLKRTASGNNTGKVTSAGFVVGAQQPNDAGILATNPYANQAGAAALGRTYFLGCFMSETLNSTFLSDAGLQGQNSVLAGITASMPIIRGAIMAASGVLIRLSASFIGTNTAPLSTLSGDDGSAMGSITGTVNLLEGGVSKQEFIMFLNGHKGTDSRYPNVITASFDMNAANYFPNVLNKNPLALQTAGHYLYTFWDIHPSIATVTGTGLVYALSGAAVNPIAGKEASAFITTGTLGQNTGASDTPNWENFEDRYSAPKTSWIISQKFGGQPLNLFRFWSLDDGVYSSMKFKFSIENIAPSSDPNDKYGTFDVLVRDLYDNDLSQNVLERFRGVNLNPSSNNYIAKVVGDQRVYYDWDIEESGQKVTVVGNYPNKSNLVRVEVAQSVDDGTLDPTALPLGFRGMAHLVTSGTAGLTSPFANSFSPANQFSVPNVLKLAVQPPVPLRKHINDGSGITSASNSAYYWGVQFEHPTSLDGLNSGKIHNKSIDNFAKYFPNFHTAWQNPLVGDNQGTADTATNGILDADRFNNNIFTLENIQVVTGTDTNADPLQWVNSFYYRPGRISANDLNKTRAFKVTDCTTPNRRYAKFSFFMQGGFDGANVFDDDANNFTNNAVTEEMNSTARGLASGPTVKSWLKALYVMTNTEDVDIQLLALPGVRHPSVTNAALISTMNDRNDALYLMDIEEYDVTNTFITSSLQMPSVANTIQSFANRSVDSSFGAAYYPDVNMTDPSLKTTVTVPASAIAIGAMGLNDALGFPWFAPAGFIRGALPTVTSAKVPLTRAGMDNLYDNRINPIVSFPGPAGYVVWGQKTLQIAHTSLDRVNVRRLLIDVRRKIRDVGKGFLFEPNRAVTLQRFSAAIDPILAKVQGSSGIDRYKIKIDTTTTTQVDIDNNTIRGQIVLQPTKSIEFVALDFVVTSLGGLGI